MKNQETSYYKFSRRQIRLLIFITSCSFIFFLFLMFPTSNLIVYILQKNLTYMEFTYEKFYTNIIGNIEARNIHIYHPKFFIGNNKLDLQLGFLTLLRGGIKSLGQAEGTTLQSLPVSVKIDSITWDIQISELPNFTDDGRSSQKTPVHNLSRGNVSLYIKNATVQRIVPFLAQYLTSEILKKLIIEEINIQMESRAKNYFIKQAVLTSNIIRLQAKGHIDEFFTFQNTQVCLQKQPNTETLAPLIFSFFILESSDELCFQILGKISEPKFRKVENPN